MNTLFPDAARRLVLPIAAAAAVNLPGTIAYAAGPMPVVADFTAKSSPISIFQSAFTPGDDGRGVLWLAFTNRSRELVVRFLVKGRWVDRGNVERGSFTAVMSTVVGAGERTTARSQICRRDPLTPRFGSPSSACASATWRYGPRRR